jgi:hypothetical protein
MIISINKGYLPSSPITARSDQNKKNWYSTILSLLKYLKLDLRFVMNSKTNLKHFLYTKLKSNYNKLWFLSLHDDKINYIISR